MTDYNLIDRITAIRLELENETSNSYRILIAVRNILHQSDGMSYSAIRNILITYYNLNPIIGINTNIINLITSPNANLNNSINSLLLNQYNTNNQHNTSEDLLDDNSDIETTDNSLSISEDESIDEDNLEQQNQNPINNETPIINNSSFLFYNNPNVVDNQIYGFVQSLFTGPQNINNVQPMYHNMFNSLLSVSNSLDVNLNDIEATNNIFPLFNIPQNENIDIPIVITNESFDKLRKCKYVELNDDIKKKNPKCMITLETFNDDDNIIVLPCDHAFLYDEITDWLKNNSYKCPSCRHPCGGYYAKI
jgi:hypothetical protein